MKGVCFVCSNTIANAEERYLNKIFKKFITSQYVLRYFLMRGYGNNYLKLQIKQIILYQLFLGGKGGGSNFRLGCSLMSPLPPSLGLICLFKTSSSINPNLFLLSFYVENMSKPKLFYQSLILLQISCKLSFIVLPIVQKCDIFCYSVNGG